MKRIRPRLISWILGWLALFLLANLRLRPFPHILLIFWSLLPLLSILFSHFSANLLKAEIRIQPRFLERNTPGLWICELTNESRFMAFFLTFPSLKVSHKGKNEKARIMLAPKEKRELKMQFELPYTGPYQLKTEEPSYEDFLGFIQMRFKEKKIIESVDCYGLPSARAFFLERKNSPSAYGLEASKDHKTQTASSDEIFSIDPHTQGETLAHAHWKLSAKLGKWMIKHYSDNEQEPLHIIVHTYECPSPEAHFLPGPLEPLSDRDRMLLEERTLFLDRVSALCLSLSNRRQVLELADESGDYTYFEQKQTPEDIRFWLAQLPFHTENKEWQIEAIGDKEQLVLIQRFDEKTLGNLLRLYDSGISFSCGSFQSMNEEKMISQVNRSPLQMIWLDNLDHQEGIVEK